MNKLAGIRRGIAKRMKIENFTQEMMAKELGMSRVALTHAEKWETDHPKYKFYLAAYEGVRERINKKSARS